MSKIISPLKYNTFKLAIEDEVYFGDDGVLYIGKKDRTLQVYLSNQGAITQAIQSLNGLNASSQTFANDINIVINSAGATHTLGWLGVLSTLRGGTGLSAIGSPLQVLRVNSVGTSLEYATVSGTGTVTSVSLNMPSAFTVVGSPITTAGTFTVSGAGTSSQYIDGTGALQTFPSGGTGTVTTVSTAGLISGGPITTTGTITTSMNTNKLVGRATAGVGIMEEITLGTGLSFSGTTLNATGGGGIKSGTASGTNNYTVTISGVSSYTDGDTYVIKFTNGNDDDSDININGLGAKNLEKQANIRVTGGDIVSGQELIIIYDGTHFQTLGVAPNQLFAYVTNDDSVTITKGQPVYAFGAAGNRMSVKLANNTSDSTSAQTVGVVFSSSIAPNQKGFIITQGVISGVNTSAYSPGAQLYLGATAGTLTATKPYAPNHLVYIGIVERANAGNGQIYVKPQNGYELNELHDVDLITNAPVNNDLLTYVSGSPNLWKNRSLGAILGGTTSQYVRGDGTLATTPTGTVTGVTATSPITSSGGTAPVISTSMATNRLIGRSTAGAGVMEEIQVGSGLLLTSGTLSADIQSEENQIFINHWNTAPNIKGTSAVSSGTIPVAGWGFMPRYLQKNTTISQIAFRAVSCAANMNVRIGMYNARYDSTLGAYFPDVLLADSGLIPIATTDPFPAIITYTLPTPITVTGWIFLVIRGSSNSVAIAMTPNLAATTILGLYPAILSSGSGTTGSKFIFGVSSAVAVTSPLPNPWTATVTITGSANIPLLYFKVI
jgi:hypothetical protein